MPECNHPKPLYGDTRLEDIVRGFNLTAYPEWAKRLVLRAGRKLDRMQALEKAQGRLDREIQERRRDRELVSREIQYLESAHVEPPFECDCHAAAPDAAQPVSQADGFSGHMSA